VGVGKVIDRREIMTNRSEKTRHQNPIEVRFRLAISDDLGLVLEMMVELQENDPWSCRFDEARARGAMEQLLRDPALGRVWVIEEGSKTIGYIVMAFDYSLEYQGKGAWVDEFYVRRSHRSRGIGAKALEFFAEQALSLGVKAIHLEVNHGNPAIELYRRKGFEEHGRYLMTKWIAPKG
jgi:GNAT superfamily N-acetyltransferase